jgi:hypothetical protein
MTVNTIQLVQEAKASASGERSRVLEYSGPGWNSRPFNDSGRVRLTQTTHAFYHTGICKHDYADLYNVTASSIYIQLTIQIKCMEENDEEKSPGKLVAMRICGLPKSDMCRG